MGKSTNRVRRAVTAVGVGAVIGVASLGGATAATAAPVQAQTVHVATTFGSGGSLISHLIQKKIDFIHKIIDWKFPGDPTPPVPPTGPIS